jgi:protein-disulfide isomerase
MKPSHILLATAAILASGACNAQKGRDAATADTTTAEPVKPPANGDWSTVVAATSAGGYRMGSPDAKVKLVEFGSMTCPHCREFDETGVQPLIDKYVKSGKVSYEFRNYVRDPYDIAVALIARCNGSKSFFPLTRALYKDQMNWIGKLQAMPPQQLESLNNLPPQRQFLEVTKAVGLQQWAAMRGVPAAKSTACLTNQDSVNQLVQMNSDATNQYDVPGTPAFLINGKLMEQTVTWPQLEPKIREALGG